MKDTVHKRIEYLEQCVLACARYEIPSLIITGQGGVGKSHTVTTTIKNNLPNYLEYTTETLDVDYLNSLSDDRQLQARLSILDDCDAKDGYCILKGYSTARGLYNVMYLNSSKVIIFDDCDSILKDPVGINIFKAALDSNAKRTVTWNSDKSGGSNTLIPSSFDFTGSVIFISNLPTEKIDQAIRTRSICVDLSMTVEEILDRIEIISYNPTFMPEVSSDIKHDCLVEIVNLADSIQNISLRSYITAIKLHIGCKNWKDILRHTLAC